MKRKNLPKLKDRCQMCGKRNLLSLQVALDPDCKLKTLCQECREGSLLLVIEARQNLRDAAREVINNWSSGDLASAVNNLDAAL